jgi:hypothetical protein
MWSSIHARSYTLLIIITLFYAVFSNGHHHATVTLAGQTQSSQRVQCQQSDCPPATVVVHTVTTPAGDGSDGAGGSGLGEGTGALDGVRTGR